MNAPTFDAHSSLCPVCHRRGVPLLKPNKLWTGLLICKHCQERIVVSWSGHYVRDPFRLRQSHIERSLRRESHPIFRILRDLKGARPSLVMIILMSSLLVGILAIGIRMFSPGQVKSSQPSSLLLGDRHLESNQ